VTSVAFSPDGKILASGGGNMVRLWDMVTRRLLEALPAGSTSAVTSIAFSPDGRMLAIGSNHAARLWDVASTRPSTAFATSNTPVTSVAFSPDGQLLAVGDSGGDIALWSVPSRHMIAHYPTGATVNGIAFSPSGNALAVGNSAGKVDLLDEQGNLIATYSDGGQSVSSVAFRSGTATLAVANSAGKVQLFSLPNSLKASSVSLAPGPTLTPTAAKAKLFVDEYFTAINEHNYAKYKTLLTLQQQTAQTQSSFDAGYATVTDSGITLTGVSEASAGQVVAQLTFTSIQNPAASVDNSACNQWNISLYLVPSGNGYLITGPPSNYQPHYSDC
jgi:WD40 repeat protein